jgi:hypothetical protein
MEHFGPTLTPSAKFGYDRFTEDGGSPKPTIHVDFGFFGF